MNPILPLEHCVPDGEPRVMPDGRLYLYGSYDICGDDTYCSREYHAFSTDNLVDWTHHGRSFHRDDSHCDIWARLYAPDCIHRDGKYCLTYCGSGAHEGIAVADTPYGPFKGGFAVDGADKDAIDPTILLDDDGQERSTTRGPSNCTLTVPVADTLLPGHDRLTGHAGALPVFPGHGLVPPDGCGVVLV